MEPTQTKSQTRILPFRFRFTLRTLLFSTLMFTPVFGWLGNTAYQQKMEAAELERLQELSGQRYAVQRGGELGSYNYFS